MDQNADDRAVDVARRIVAAVAPEELGSFDDIRADLARGEADIAAQRHGSGGEITVDVWTLLIIPLASALVERTVDWTIEAISQWLRQRRGGRAHAIDPAVARAALDVVSSPPNRQSDGYGPR
jgi:hypothetical protein